MHPITERLLLGRSPPLDPSPGAWYGADLSFLYPLERDARRSLPEEVTWRYQPHVVRYVVEQLHVPGDLETHDLTIEFWRQPPYDTYGQAPMDYPRVFTTVARRRKHVFDDGALCLWYPWDPIERRWTHELGLLVLIEMVRRQLLLEMHWFLTGDWPLDEAPHGLSAEQQRAAGGGGSARTT